VATARVGDRIEGFRFRRLEKPEEFRQVDELVRATWGEEAGAGLSPTLLRILQDNGGLVLGAFADIYLAGFSVGLLGWDGTTLYLHSYLTAVRPEYQNHHLGFRLKAFQRDEVLKLGLGEIRWVFDPLQSRNAWLMVRRLGGRPDRYYPHYFGQLPDAINQGLETDRVRVVWPLAAPRVEERMAGAPIDRAADARALEASFAIVETETGEHGLRVPTAVAEPTGPKAHLEIPFDLALVREHEPGSLRRWRHAVRDAFRAALDQHYVVEDFAVVTSDHERRSFYLLSPAPPSPEEPAAPGA
jgi:predicted GNAT superfamily acetyltransferase